ncbi:hypothetical protein K4L44_01260 [Halosquirtibacter laminarini]|uniref:Uncharacterized protein n=1 Tax=Halosquirtibacter laminarini TaxID=3374600 RepID=A0AC61NG53_9BACT|nr:hypothetical protein K4L44_01260 [Prolixibacteraceae bacterium]
MQLLFILLFSISLLVYAIQISALKNRRHQCIYLCIPAILIWLLYSKCIQQSYLSLEAMLNNNNLTSLLLSIQMGETILFCVWGMMFFRYQMTSKGKPWYRNVKYIPNMMIIPSLFVLVTLSYLQFPGYDFDTFAYILMGIIPLSIWAIGIILKKISRTDEIMLETKMTLHLLQGILSVILSIQLYALPIKQADKSLEIAPFMSVLILTGVGIIIGKYMHQINMKKLIKKYNDE